MVEATRQWLRWYADIYSKIYSKIKSYSLLKIRSQFLFPAFLLLLTDKHHRTVALRLCFDKFK